MKISIQIQVSAFKKNSQSAFKYIKKMVTFISRKPILLENYSEDTAVHSMQLYRCIESKFTLSLVFPVLWKIF